MEANLKTEQAIKMLSTPRDWSLEERRVVLDGLEAAFSNWSKDEIGLGSASVLWSANYVCKVNAEGLNKRAPEFISLLQGYLPSLK